MSPPDLTKPCHLSRRNYFFHLHVANRTIITHYGRGTGAGGRQTKKTFRTKQDALKTAQQMLSDKLHGGYKLDPAKPPKKEPKAEPQTMDQDEHPGQPPVRRSSRKRSAPSSYVAEPASKKRTPGAKNTSPAKSPAQGRTTLPRAAKSKVGTRNLAKKTKRGLRGAPAVLTSKPLGMVDPESGITDGVIATVINESAGLDTLDVMLALVDIAKRHDKFIVLQLIFNADTDEFVFYERWGRTGTSGQALKLEFPSLSFQDAFAEFKNKFEDKTGLAWEDRSGNPVDGKYRFVQQDLKAKHEAASNMATWQYWVDDAVDGKTTGWYNYDDFGGSLAEQLYQEFMNNIWLTQRIVQSGVYAYLVDLQSMTQENVVHPNHTVRHIRRVPPNEVPDNTDPVDYIPSMNVHNVQVMALKVTKPIPAIPIGKPAHQVKPAPNAIVPTRKSEPKKQPKREPKKSAVAELLVKTEEVTPVIPVDDACPKANEYHVVEEWDATLNQSNIMGGNNNNKYYRIQLLKHSKKKTFHVWTRWGRVGESRGTQTKLMGPFNEQERAENAFGKKFRDKTGNEWEQRDVFCPVGGKYVMIDIDHTAKKEEDQTPLVMKVITGDPGVEYLPSTLAKETKELVELLFQKDVYTNAMKEFDIDIRRMPLGSLSEVQIEKGVSVLEEIEDALNGSPLPTSSELERLSSKFYTTLPHDFGRRRPPVISNLTMLQRSYDMCNVLRDMEKATTLMSEAEDKASKPLDKKKVPHPADSQYESLNADLSLVQPGSKEFDIVTAAYSNTVGSNRSKLLNIWRVERKGEAARFESAPSANHMLLWHGSHIGAISAILATGLRIMPHSGGRVGRGIYLASENAKSMGYTVPAMHNNVGCMFLAQAALGKACEIFQDDNSLERAPNGYDSVRACGRQAPNSFETLVLDSTQISVPVGAPCPLARAASSSFWQDEYLVYNEAQARIRYVITIKK